MKEELDEEVVDDEGGADEVADCDSEVEDCKKVDDDELDDE